MLAKDVMHTLAAEDVVEDDEVAQVALALAREERGEPDQGLRRGLRLLALAELVEPVQVLGGGVTLAVERVVEDQPLDRLFVFESPRG